MPCRSTDRRRKSKLHRQQNLDAEFRRRQHAVICGLFSAGSALNFIYDPRAPAIDDPDNPVSDIMTLTKREAFAKAHFRAVCVVELLIPQLATSKFRIPCAAFVSTDRRLAAANKIRFAQPRRRMPALELTEPPSQFLVFRLQPAVIVLKRREFIAEHQILAPHHRVFISQNRVLITQARQFVTKRENKPHELMPTQSFQGSVHPRFVHQRTMSRHVSFQDEIVSNSSPAIGLADTDQIQ